VDPKSAPTTPALMPRKSGRPHKRLPWGSVRRLRSGKWQARCPDPERPGRLVPAPKTFANRVDAERWLAGQRADQDRGGWVDPKAGRVTFEDYARRLVAQRAGLRVRTREDYTSLLEHHLVPPFGARALAAITPGQVREWYETLAQTQPGRAHKAYRLLRTIMNTAVADRLIITSPCVLKGAGQDRSAERPVATVEQVDALAAAVPERYRLLVELAAWCSLRYGELAALRRGRLDLLHGTVEVREALAITSS
jgi:hypothetical protein